MTLINAGQEEHLEERGRKKLLAHFEESRTDPKADWPRTRLAKFLDLYEACRKYLPQEVATDAHKRDLKCLNNDRNYLIHFGEGDLSMMPRRARTNVRAGIKLVMELSPNGTQGLYRSRLEEARYDLAITSVLRLLDAADADEATLTDEDDDARYAELEARLATLGDDGPEG
jgi:hypothetical protein